KAEGRLYDKKTNVFAKRLSRSETVSTYTSDGLETINEGHSGDYLVRNQTGSREEYVVEAKQFEKRYRWIASAADGFEEYRATGQVVAVELTPECRERLGLPATFHFEAAWGDDMVAKSGDFMVAPPALGEVYRIARQEFGETYEPASVEG
ncbi:MAG TPA: PGDYG domain-containing protein, partial [Saprospiraceae bacterium]|nr:PGDYG domain-containing protein [Saprospiraceae bacterium]